MTIDANIKPQWDVHEPGLLETMSMNTEDDGSDIDDDMDALIMQHVKAKKFKTKVQHHTQKYKIVELDQTVGLILMKDRGTALNAVLNDEIDKVSLITHADNYYDHDDSDDSDHIQEEVIVAQYGAYGDDVKISVNQGNGATLSALPPISRRIVDPWPWIHDLSRKSKIDILTTPKLQEQINRFMRSYDFVVEGGVYDIATWKNQFGLTKAKKVKKTKKAKSGQVVRATPRCDSKTAQGKMCKRHAKKGGKKCWQHSK